MTELKPGDHVLLWHLITDEPVDFHIGIVKEIVNRYVEPNDCKRANVLWLTIGGHITGCPVERLRKIDDEEQLAIYLLAAL